MRNTSFTLLSITTTMVLLGVGCQQTTGTGGAGSIGTIGGSPLSGTPLGSLTPIPPGQNAPIGPFGSPTRVTPPPTRAASGIAPPGGSFQGGSLPQGGSGARFPGFSGGSGTSVTPNNYLGAPVSQNQLSPGGFAPRGFAPQGNTAPNNFRQDSFAANGTGGVRQSAFTETGARVAPGQPNSSVTRDPRAGGMRTIDLTTAINSFNPAVGGNGFAQNGFRPGFGTPNPGAPFAGNSPTPIPFRNNAFGGSVPSPLRTPLQNAPQNFAGQTPNNFNGSRVNLPPSSLPSTSPNFNQPRPPFPSANTAPLPQVNQPPPQPQLANEPLNFRRPNANF